MRVGLDKLTLLDYPGKMAAIIFFPGCNMQCPFCQNADIAYGDNPSLPTMIDEVLKYLEQRKNVLDGVVISGGEPLMRDIEDILRKIHNLGYSIKIDTNCTNPGLLQYYIREGLVDYIAMDIKNSQKLYAKTCGLNPFTFMIGSILESIDIIMRSGIEYEFRTTVVNPIHTVDSIKDIGRKLIFGAERYYLQPFVRSDPVMQRSFEEPTDDFMVQALKAVKPYVKNCAIRGRDIPAE